MREIAPTVRSEIAPTQSINSPMSPESKSLKTSINTTNPHPKIRHHRIKPAPRSGDRPQGDLMTLAIALPQASIQEFCDRWQIIELSVFGSILRDDFRPDSDIDLLVSFAPTANWGLLEHSQMQQELEAMLGRSVDLISKRAIERSSNWIRRHEILSTAQTIYVK
jgi:uncharacterized protein